jgi:ceramide glucosyltransferase
VTFVLIAAAVAGVYQLLALAAAIRHILAHESPARTAPPVSILKPVRGLDPHFYEAIRSHAVQDYPEYEIIFGVRDPDDPCIPEIERLRAEFPERAIRLVMTSHKEAPNRKVGTLIDLAAAARYPILIVNDGDVRVPRDYIGRVIAPLNDPQVGLVTCLYSAKADNWPSRWEMLGVVTDFPASVLVARLVGVSGFGLGATLAFRAEQLRQSGGFEALAAYLADDYQLGKRIAGLGYRVALSRVVVETNLGDITWGEAWRHQLRWARAIRLSRGGYAGLPVTHAILWALLAALKGIWWITLPLVALDLAVSLIVGVVILKCTDTLKYCYLIPLRDFWGLAVWAGGLFGDTVVWGGSRLKLDKQGRIVGTG